MKEDSNEIDIKSTDNLFYTNTNLIKINNANNNTDINRNTINIYDEFILKYSQIYSSDDALACLWLGTIIGMFSNKWAHLIGLILGITAIAIYVIGFRKKQKVKRHFLNLFCFDYNDKTINRNKFWNYIYDDNFDYVKFINTMTLEPITDISGKFKYNIKPDVIEKLPKYIFE